MKMQSMIVARVLALVGSAFFARQATAGFVVPVSADTSVNAANPEGLLGSFKDNGGLFAGLDQTGSDYRFYLKFILPETSEPVTKATLRGFYTSDLAFIPTFIGARLVTDDSWNELTTSASNAPTSVGDPLAGELFSGEPGRFFKWDITPAFKTEIAGDKVLSLEFATIDGRFGDMKFFASREYGQVFDPTTPFALEVETSTPSAVPLPPAALGAVACMLIPLTRRGCRKILSAFQS
jgi:hypothetical protein